MVAPKISYSTKEGRKPVKLKTLRIHIICSLVVLFLATGCTVTETLTFRNNTSHTSVFDFTVEEFFIAVLEDFGEFAPQTEDDPLMDRAIADFRVSLQRSRATSNVQVGKLADNDYRGSFQFSDLHRLVTDLGAGSNQTLLNVKQNSLTFYLDIDNYDQLVPVIPFLADENFEAFGPAYNQGLSEADYLEMISFMLGEEGPPAIEKSFITLRIQTPGDIVSFTNGRKVANRVYEFTFPLIDFLLLAKPITFTVTWL